MVIVLLELLALLGFLDAVQVGQELVVLSVHVQLDGVLVGSK